MKLLSLTDDNMLLLSKVLDLRATNEKVIASNIANSETPGYTPSKFEFENELKNAIDSNSFTIQTTEPGHISLSAANVHSVKGNIVKQPDTTNIGDLNGVSLEQEMLNLSENELLYETTAQLLKKKMSILRYVIQGGK